MINFIALPRRSLTKTSAIHVFRVVRRVLDGAGGAGEAVHHVGKDIAEAWAESRRERPSPEITFPQHPLT